MSLSQKVKFWAIWVVMATMAVCGLTLVMVPTWRLRVQGFLLPDDRTLLATVTGPLLADGSIYKALKFQTSRGIIVELLKPTGHPERPFEFADRVSIPDRHDGYLQLKEQTTRLAIVDLDNDGQVELIAPTFDDDLVAHINAFHLNPDTLKMELARPAAQKSPESQ